VDDPRNVVIEVAIVFLVTVDSPTASASPASAAGLASQLSSPGLLLALLGHVAMRKLREAHAAEGVSPRQFHLLSLLHDHGPAGQRELGVWTGTDPSILVTLLNPLESEGLISRRRDREDRRRQLVTLTPEGEERLARVTTAHHAAEDEIFAALDADQRRQLTALLMALRDGLADEAVIPCAVTPPSSSSPPPEDPSHADN
jgi:DNA-binding MarR family transcriptional regulator